MKHQIKKISFLAVLSIFSLGSSLAQEGTKKNVIGAGVGYNDNHGSFVSHLFYNRMITPKLAIGARMFLTPFKYEGMDYLTAEVEFSNYKGTRLDFSVAASYYLIGNNDSKFGLYTGLGIGYAAENLTYLVQFTGNPVFDVRDYENGLSGNATIGLNYKVGPGKIFAEFNLSYIFIGNIGESYEYPSGYPSDANGNPTPLIGFDYIQKGVSGSFPEPCYNLGYQISF